MLGSQLFGMFYNIFVVNNNNTVIMSQFYTKNSTQINKTIVISYDKDDIRNKHCQLT